ncbi:MAG: NUDIX hydrolase [Clostridia bacterium]|nr:NUDIX hydrolase [Clostridia bacterium]
MYKTEAEFLKNYNPKNYDQLSMTSDILLLSISSEKQDNYRKINEKKLSILLVKRDDFPFKDMWCLPGGFLNPNTETLEDTAKRILKSEVNLENIYLEQLYTYDNLNRDPRCRVVSTSFIALVDKNKISGEINPNASWFNMEFVTDNDKSMKINLDNGEISFKIECKKQVDSTSKSIKYEITKNDFIAFDHPLIIFNGIDRVRNKIDYADLVFYMMPKHFTLGELQKVYEAILNKKLLEPAFRRTIANKVKKTNYVQTGEGHRPSVLFTYKKN